MAKLTFCDINQDIRTTLSAINDLIERGIKYESLEGEISDIQYELNKLADLVEDTQDCVDSMENRLREYRDAIENLGFKREEK